jgi:hypothetical protein
VLLLLTGDAAISASAAASPVCQYCEMFVLAEGHD